MTLLEPDTEQLLLAAADGDESAGWKVLDRHRQRLRQMIAVRMDSRLAARFDPSDVVQETLAGAWQRLGEYLRQRPLPFFPWLRQMAQERLIDMHRQHIGAKKRSVKREEPMPDLPDGSALELAQRLLARGSSPSAEAIRGERVARVRSALARLNKNDREVLVLRHLEHLSPREIAEVLGIKEGTVHVRHLRALQRLQAMLGDDWADR